MTVPGPVVVTGGSGFLGGAVIAQLVAAGVTDIRSLDLGPVSTARNDASPCVRQFQCDLRSDRLETAFEGATTVLHLAGCQYHTPVARTTYELPFFAINVEGTRRVIEAAQTAGARHLVFVSSNMVYGLPQELPVVETHRRAPFGPYGRSKLAAEQLVEAAQSRTLDCSVVRPGLIVGPGRAGLIERVFGWIHEQRPIVMIGNGKNRYEVMHVTDVASLVIAAASRVGFGVYNCASASVPTMREWIEAVTELAGSRSRIVGVPGRVVKPLLAVLERARLAPLRRDQYLIADRDYFMDATLAQRELGWTPTYTGLAAVLDTYRWYLEKTKRPAAGVE